MPEATTRNHAAFIWSIADLLRGNFKQNDYGDVILPLVVLRRIDCVLGPTREAVLEAHAKYADTIDNIAPVLEGAAGHSFYNTARIGFEKLLDDPANLADNLRAYIAGFSTNARQIIEKFKFDTQITELDKAKLLFQVIGRFCEIDLHPDKVDNMEMGYLYEELIRHFSELSNETAGEHFTPREVIKLMVNLLLVEDDELLAKPGIIKTMLDPACGTGGMLSVAQDHLRDLNADARLEVFGQELNPETWAVCCSDLLLKGQDSSNVILGNSFSEDGHAGGTFDYLLANPPFGVEWTNVKNEVVTEHRTQGFGGRFGAGFPRINDGSLLFLQHMISKMKPTSQGGSRLAIVFNGSPLFTGAAGSNESEIRRWIIENDWLEAVVALPDQLFYNTGINIYFWIVTNRKAPSRQGKVQLIDARESWSSMSKSLGDKRKELTDDQIADVVRLYDGFEENDRSKIFTNQSFGHMRITVERPLHLRWEVNDETVADLKADKTFQKLFESGHYDDMDPDEGWELAGEVFDRTFAELHGQRFESEATLAQALGTAAAAAWEDVEHPFEDTEFLGGKDPFGEAMNLKPATAKKLLKPFALQDPDAPIVTKRDGASEPDSDLQDNENVPIPDQTVIFDEDPTERLEDGTHQQAVNDYMNAEVLPYAADAWVDHTKTKLGYEIPLTRHFYTYTPTRPLKEIEADILACETQAVSLKAGRDEVIRQAVGKEIWPEVRLKHHALVRSSNVDKKSTEGETQVRLINYTDVYYGDRLGPSDELMVATATPSQIRKCRLELGDVVITKDSETADDIGVPAFIESSAPDLVCGYHLTILRANGKTCSGRYLYYVMCSPQMRGQLGSLANGVTRFGLRLDDIRSASFRLPDPVAQSRVVDQLDRFDAEHEDHTQLLKQLADLYSELREALFATSVDSESSFST